MRKMTTVTLIALLGLLAICFGQNLQQQAAVSRANCEQGLRAKGCTGITSSCDFKQWSYSCKCRAASCPTGGSSTYPGIFGGNREIRTNGCWEGGPSRCPTGYCCGPASTGSPDNMRICYPPGSPC